MLHTANPVIKHKAGLLNLAEELSNVSKACKIMGVSRDTFYRYRELVAEGGVDAQINRSRRAPNLKNRTDEATEQAVVDYAVAFPTHGQHRASNELRKQGVFISDPHRRTATVPRFFDFQLLHQVCFEHLTDNFSDTGRSQLRQTGKIDTRDWTKLINQAINRARVGLLAPRPFTADSGQPF